MIVSSAENNCVMLDDVVSSQIWSDALAEYGRSSNVDINSLPQVRNLDEILDLIGTKQSSFLLRRHDGRRLDKIRSAIGKNLLPIQRMIEAVSFSAGKAFAPAEAIFGAVKVLIEAAQIVSDGYDRILDGFRVMENYFDQLNILKGKEITPGIRKAVLNVFLKTVIMLMNYYHHISKRRTSLFMKNIFLGESSDLKSILQSYKEEIEQQRAIIEIESHVNINNLIKHAGISDRKADDYHEISTNNVRNIDQKVTNIATKLNTQRENDNIEGILKWLTELNFEESIQNFLKNRLKGTCTWVFQHDAFQRWYTGDKGQILWCYGKAGAGKSTITSAVVEYIKASTQTDIREGAFGCGKVAVSYFYCDSQNEKTHSGIELLSIICKALVKYSFSFAEEVASLRNKIGGRPSEDDLSALIQSNSKYFHRVFVLIDALDECPRGCRNKFSKLIEKLEPHVHFFISSRSNINLKSLIRAPLSSIKIDDANKLDIETYLRSVINEDTNFNDVIERKPEAKEEIIKTIADRVEGMFLLAHYQINDVCEQCTLEDAYSCLESSLNTNVNNYYDKNLQRLEQLQEKAKSLTKRAIAYVHFARRPLNVDEFCHALSIRDGDTKVNLLGIPVISVLKNHSAGLLLFGENGTLGLVHLTLHEYFNEHPEKLGLEPEADLASACLVYLSFDTFSAGPCNDNNDLKVRLREYPFLEYAAHNLGYHLKKVSRFQNQERFQSIFDFLKDSNRVSSLLQVLYLPKYWTTKSYNRFPKYYSPLHIVAYFGIHELLPQICDSLTDLVQDYHCHLTPFEVAAEQGQHESLKYILDKELYIPFCLLNCVLRRAAESGYHETVKMLLTHRTVTDFLSNSDISTIFCSAVRRGHVDVVLSFWSVYSNNEVNFWNDLDRFIIIIAEHGTVEVAQTVLANCSKNRKSLEKTLMCRAIAYGNKEICNILLWKGVNLPSWKEVEDVHGICRFVSDRVFSNLSLTDHLLQHGMKANTKTRDDATGLIVAAVTGQEEVALLLLNNGADVNIPDLREFTPLHYAAAMGHERLVKLLLEKGADPNLTDERGWLTPLHVAILNNQGSVTQLLMDETVYGKEITNLLDRMAKENTPLYQLMKVAVERKTMFIEYSRPSSDSSATYGRGQDLLEVGADIDTKHNNGCTALFTAARDDDVETLEFIIANGARVNKKNRFMETALHATCEFGTGKSVSILLSNKAEVDAQAFGRTPLLLAAQKGDFSTVKLLAQWEANINWEDCHGRRAIHWCAAHGTCNDLQYLITEGANVNAQDYWGKTSLIWTIVHHTSKDSLRYMLIADQHFSEISSKIEILLQNRAEINTTCRDGCSALHHATCSRSNKILLRLLSIKDIKVDLKAKGNFRPIDIAIMTGNMSKLKLLLENGAEIMAEEHRCTVDFDFEEDFSRYYAAVDETLFRDSGMEYNNLTNYLSSKLLKYDWKDSKTKFIDETISGRSKDNEWKVNSESEKVETEQTAIEHITVSENEEPTEEIDFQSFLTENNDYEDPYTKKIGTDLANGIFDIHWEARDLKTLYRDQNVKTEFTVLDLAIFGGNKEVQRLVKDDLAKSKRDP